VQKTRSDELGPMRPSDVTSGQATPQRIRPESEWGCGLFVTPALRRYFFGKKHQVLFDGLVYWDGAAGGALLRAGEAKGPS